MNNLKLVSTKDYLLLVDVSDQSEGMRYFPYTDLVYNADEDRGIHPDSYKVLAHLPLNDAPVLEGLLLLPKPEGPDAAAKKWLESRGWHWDKTESAAREVARMAVAPTGFEPEFEMAEGSIHMPRTYNLYSVQIERYYRGEICLKIVDNILHGRYTYK